MKRRPDDYTHLDSGEYDFYIHGTNSLALAMMSKTNFEILSPLNLLQKFQLAPPSGEITFGGLGSLHSEANTSFTRLRSTNKNNYGQKYNYTLQTVIKNYAIPRSSDRHVKMEFKRLLEELDSKLIRNLTSSDSRDVLSTISKNINPLLVFMARIKQNGKSLPASNKIKILSSNMQDMIEVFYLIKLIGTYLLPSVPPSSINDTYLKLFTLPFLSKAIFSGHSFKDAFRNPTPEKLSRIADLFKINGHSIFTISTQPANKPAHDNDTNLAEKLKSLINANNYFSIPEFFLFILHCDQLTTQGFDRLYKTADNIIEPLENKRATLLALLQKESKKIFSSKTDRELTSKPFPLIFGFENKRNLNMIQIGGPQEFRLEKNHPLKIPDDISIIATDTPKHQAIVQNFLRKHNIKGVTVVLFDQLKEWKHAGKIQPTVKPTTNDLKREYEAQVAKRNKLEKAIAMISSIFLPALPLSIRLWLHSKGTENIVKITLSDTELANIKFNRKGYWQAYLADKAYHQYFNQRDFDIINKNRVRVTQTPKPQKKITDSETPGMKTLYLDKHAAHRMGLFANNNAAKTIANTQPAALQASKEKSRNLSNPKPALNEVIFLEKMGAMNAPRAALWSLVMHNFFLTGDASGYVKQSLRKIADFINSDVNNVLLLILLTSASQNRCENELKNLGLNEKQTRLFSSAIEFKNDPEKYLEELLNLGIARENIYHFDYIRRLVKVGENLNSMPRQGRLGANPIFNFVSMPAYIGGPMLNRLMEEIHKFIHKKHDMRAENVFAKMLKEASNNPIFKSYLQGVSLPNAKQQSTIHPPRP